MRLLLMIPALLVAAGLEYLPLDRAKEVAAKEGKIVLVQLTSPRCHYCVWMERTTLQDPEVITAIKRRFVPVRIDVSRSTRFRWSMTPTFLFLDPSGKEIKRVPGAWKKEDFLQILGEVKR